MNSILISAVVAGLAWLLLSKDGNAALQFVLPNISGSTGTPAATTPVGATATPAPATDPSNVVQAVNDPGNALGYYDTGDAGYGGHHRGLYNSWAAPADRSLPLAYARGAAFPAPDPSAGAGSGCGGCCGCSDKKKGCKPINGPSSNFTDGSGGCMATSRGQQVNGDCNSKGLDEAMRNQQGAINAGLVMGHNYDFSALQNLMQFDPAIGATPYEAATRGIYGSESEQIVLGNQSVQSGYDLAARSVTRLNNDLFIQQTGGTVPFEYDLG